MPGFISERLVWGGVLGTLVLILLWSRLAGLDLAFWHDEVFTVTRYVDAGPRGIFFGDYVPNNHVLFSLLTWATTSLVGSSEVAFRAWSVVPALVATGWLTWWLCRWRGPVTGTVALLLMTLSPVLLQVSREARGYGLVLLAMVGVINQAHSAIENPRGTAIWRFVAFGVLGVLTLPVFVLPFAFCALPLLSEPRLRRRLLVGLSLSAVIALVWYTPMLADIVEHSGQRFGRPVTWHAAVTLSMGQLVFPLARLLMPGTPDILLTNPPDPVGALFVWHAVAWSAIGVGGRDLWRSKEKTFLFVLVAPVVGTFASLALIGAWAADRHISYLSVPLFVLMALGAGGLVRMTQGKVKSVLLVSIAGVAIWSVVSFYPVADNLIRVPHEAFQDVAKAVNERAPQAVVSNSVRPEGLRYYLAVPLETMSADSLEELFCGPTTGYVFIDHPFKAPVVDTQCLEGKGAERARFEQRGRGERIDAWFVDRND